jgi:hypothetical protein
VKKEKLGFRPWVGRTTPMGHGGGLATLKPAGLGVAEPPLGQMGVIGHPHVASHPYNFFFFLKH